MIARLGKGGMAEVFLAFTGGMAGFTKLAVIKRLHEHLLPETHHVEMFMDEARLSAQLSHPHVVQTYEVGEHGGTLYMAMEYLEGQSLQRLAKRCWNETQEGIPSPVVCKLVIDALDGLDYAHNLRGLDGRPLDVVHRDITPHNLFVTYDGTVKVLDFGIAKAANRFSHTETGMVKGKYAYMAPEQIVGETIDQRCDIWSMGVVLWECLTGEHLFRSKNELAVFKAIVDKPIPPIRDVDPSIPEQLAKIVARALEKNREARYSTAAEFKQDLEQYLLRQTVTVSRSELGAFMHASFGDIFESHQALKQLCLELQEESSLNTDQLKVMNAKLSSIYTNTGSNPSVKSLVAGMQTIGATPSLTADMLADESVSAVQPVSSPSLKYLWVAVFAALLAAGIVVGMLLTRSGTAQPAGDDAPSSPGDEAAATSPDQGAPQGELAPPAGTAKNSGEAPSPSAADPASATQGSPPAGQESTAGGQATSSPQRSSIEGSKRGSGRRRGAQSKALPTRGGEARRAPLDIRTRR
jgi:serine/threonine-protein kinase